MLAMHILRALHRVMMTVGNSGAGVRNVIPDDGNDGIGVHDGVLNSRDGCTCVYCKSLLEAKS